MRSGDVGSNSVLITGYGHMRGRARGRKLRGPELKFSFYAEWLLKWARAHERTADLYVECRTDIAD